MRDDKSEIISLQTENTNLKKRISELTNSEKHYKKLFEDHGAMKLIIDPDTGRIIEANKSASKFYGWSKEELSTMNISQLNTLSYEEIQQEMHKAKANKKQYFEFMHRRANGDIRNVAVYSNPIIINNRTLLHSIIHDITESKIIEQELKESRLKYKLLADYAYDWEYWIDPTGNYIYLSPSVERITGYKPQEFIENTDLLFNIIREDFREKIISHYKNGHSLDEPILKIEFPIITRSGKEKWIAHYCTPVFDESGSWVGRRGNNREITDQVVVQKALRKSEYLLNETQKMTKVGGWEYRISDKRVSWTDEVFNIYGIPIGTILAHEEGLKFYHKDDIPIIAQAFEKCIKEGKPYNLEVRFENAQNKKMWVRTSGKPVYKNDEIHKVVGNIMDITATKKLELSLQLEKNKTQKYVDLAGTILVALDSNGNIIMLNKKGYQVLGYKDKSLIGENWFDLAIPSGIRNEAREIFNKIMTGAIKSNEFYENQIITKTGKLRDIAWQNTIIMDENRIITGTLSSGEDITERKKAEEKLKSRNRELELFNEVTVGRELYMIELKKEINELLKKLGKNPKYEIPV